MKNNLFTHIPRELPQEIFEDVLNTPNVRIERIVSKGQVTPKNEWYDQKENEWVMMVKGQAKLLFEEGMVEVSLQEGDYIDIKAHQRHRVSWTDPVQETIWLAVFY
ncbi:cupin [Photobacterium swingsii]|uniref:cupin n=1 Tax=Photobacterium swingsii TaxID=680026 RepID=UPI003551FCD7